MNWIRKHTIISLVITGFVGMMLGGVGQAAPAKTITKTVPGPTQTVAGPSHTVYKTRTVNQPFTPQSCLRSIKDARDMAGVVAHVTRLAAADIGYIPAIVKAAAYRNVATVRSYYRLMAANTVRINAYKDKMLANQFPTDSAACEAS